MTSSDPDADDPDANPPPGSDAVRALVRRHWNDRAGTFDDEPQHGIHSDEQRDRWHSVLSAWTDDPPRWTLDVGCGTGVLALLLADLGHDVTGIDAAPAMIRRARSKAVAADHEIAFALGDAAALGVATDAFEQITARHLLWTLPDPAAAVAEWQRVVEPGGRLVLFEGRWDHEEVRGEYQRVHEELPMYHGRSPGELREFLTAQGLVDVEHESLRDPVLWGREPRHHKFVVAGTVPE